MQQELLFIFLYLVTNKYMMSNLVLKESMYTYKQSKNVSQGDEAWDQSGKRWDCATKIPDHLLSFSLERERVIEPCWPQNFEIGLW